MSSSSDALRVLADYFKPSLIKPVAMPVTDWAGKYYYIVETSYPIELLPHQRNILDYMFDPSNNFQTLVYSTVKKSGKTTIAGLVARYVAENWGPHAEVYCMANDLEQARGRIYQKALESIEFTPGFNRVKRVLPGQWRIIEKQAVHLPTGSILRAVSSDYKGEAGSNPTATLWSELWGYTSEASHRLWEELTPVPTRDRSIRFVETYAGFEDESDLLIDLYNIATKQGRQLTHDDIDWPFSDRPPIYVNPSARLCAYWDTGVTARRMPWQTPEYYSAQESTLRPLAYRRLHLNEWTSSVSTFIPIEWWDNCYEQLPPLDSRTPMILGVDASVSSDCTGIVGITRHPSDKTRVAVRLIRVWTPTPGNVINLGIVELAIREICKNYNVVQIAYDAYQLHKMMTDLTHDAVAWCRPFSQAADRSRADKQLYDLIRDRMIAHDGDTDLRQHVQNCAGKQLKDEDTKLRIIKKAQQAKIDLAVATSMAVYECLRLNL